MMDFPANPVPGQKFNPGTGSIYTWDGVAWNLAPVNVATARRKNLLVNPSMQISQEYGTSVVGVSGGHPVDQWAVHFSGLGGQAVLAAGGGPFGLPPGGIQSSLNYSLSSAKPSLAAGDFLQTLQIIEGYRMRELQWGTAKAIPAVARIDAACEIPGKYTLSVLSANGQSSFLKLLDLTAQWQTFVVPIPAITTGTWPKDNTAAGTIRLCAAAGTSFTGTSEGWQTGTSLVAAPGQANLAAQASKNIAFVNVGLYADPDNTGIAPPYEIPDFDDELFDCQRYFRPITIRAQTLNGSQYIGLSLPIYPPMRTAGTTAVTVLKTSLGNISVAGGAISMGSPSQFTVDANVTPTPNANTWWQCDAYLNARM